MAWERLSGRPLEGAWALALHAGSWLSPSFVTENGNSNSLGAPPDLDPESLRNSSLPIHALVIEQITVEEIAGHADQHILQERERGRSELFPDSGLARPPGVNPEVDRLLSAGRARGVIRE